MHSTSLPETPDRVLDGLRQLAEQHPVRLALRGSSMTPALCPGARVEVAPARCYVPGDVIAFRAPGGEIRVHRLIGLLPSLRTGLRYVARSDATGAWDAAIEPSKVLGRVVAVDGAAWSSRPGERRLALRDFAAGLARRALGAVKRRSRWPST